MKRRTRNAGAESDPDQVEKSWGAVSACHQKPIQPTPVFLIQSDGTVEQIGMAWTCGDSYCRKPVKHGYHLKKFRNCPEAFNQKTWDSLKEVGWVYRVERGGGLYVARNEAGEVLAVKYANAPRTPRLPVLTDQEKAAANAHQPEPPVLEDEPFIEEEALEDAPF